MDEDSLVIRGEKKLLEKHIRKSGFGVVVLHGPGGTGKTSLIRMVKNTLSEEGFFSLYIKGGKKEIDSHIIVRLTDVMTSDLLMAAKLAGFAERKFANLNRTRELIEAFDDLVIRKLEENIDLETKKVTDLCQYLSLRLSDLLIMSRTDTLQSGLILDDRVRGTIESQINKIIRDANFGGIKDFNHRWNLLAESITQDFKSILENRHGFISRKRYAGGLLIIDNYEYLSKFVRLFMEKHLIPFLESANINIKLLLVSRDAIDDFPETNVKNICLGPFSNEEAKQYLIHQGITNERKVAEIVQRTKRYPYLMDFELMSSSHSAKAVEKYFERITRWMTQQQKDWLVALSYLSHVDKAEIRKVVPARDVDRVMDWFKGEASVRCPENGKWKIIPLISEKIHAHIRTEDPELDKILTAKASIIEEELPEMQF